MSPSPPSQSGFAWPQFVLAAVVVFCCLQLATAATSGVVPTSPVWWSASTVFALLGGALVAWVSSRTTRVVIREVVHVRAEPEDTVYVDPDVLLEQAARAASRPAGAPSPLADEADPGTASEPGPGPSVAPQASSAPALPANADERPGVGDAEDAPLDPAAVVEAAFAGAPRVAATPPSAPEVVPEPAPGPTAVERAPRVRPARAERLETPASTPAVRAAAQARAVASMAGGKTDGVDLAREWIDDVVRLLAGANVSGAPDDVVVRATSRLTMLRALVATLIDEPGERTAASLRQFADALAAHGESLGAGVAVEVMVRDDVPDAWLLPTVRLRRALELLLDMFASPGAGASVQLMIAQVGGETSTLRFELRDDEVSERGLDASRLSLRVAAWLVESIGGRVEVPVQARASRRLLVRVPAEPSTEEELATGVDPLWSARLAELAEAQARPAPLDDSLVPGAGSARVPPASVRAPVRVAVASAEAPAPTAPERARPNRAPSLARVLVVDDDAMSRWSLTGQLAVHGYIADTAPGGDAALQALQDRDYRAVLLDLRMPGMNGFEVAARIRGGGGPRADVPIVGLTVEVTADEQRRCRAVGIDDVVAKPIQGEELAEALASLPARHVRPAEPPEEDVAVTSAAGAIDEVLPALDTETLDRLAAIGRASGEHDLAQRLVNTFDTKAPYTIAAVRAALGQNEMADVLVNARRLADSAGVVGAKKMEALARSLVAAAGQPDPAQVASLADELDEAFHRVRAVLRARTVIDDSRG